MKLTTICNVIMAIYFFVAINSIFVYANSPEKFTLILVSLGGVLIAAKLKSVASTSKKD